MTLLFASQILSQLVISPSLNLPCCFLPETHVCSVPSLLVCFSVHLPRAGKGSPCARTEPTFPPFLLVREARCPPDAATCCGALRRLRAAWPGFRSPGPVTAASPGGRDRAGSRELSRTGPATAHCQRASESRVRHVGLGLPLRRAADRAAPRRGGSSSARAGSPSACPPASWPVSPALPRLPWLCPTWQSGRGQPACLVEGHFQLVTFLRAPPRAPPNTVSLGDGASRVVGGHRAGSHRRLSTAEGPRARVLKIHTVMM